MSNRVDEAALFLGRVQDHLMVVADVPTPGGTREGVICLSQSPQFNELWNRALVALETEGIDAKGVPLILACRMFADSTA